MYFSKIAAKTTLATALLATPALLSAHDDMREDRAIKSATHTLSDPATQDRVAHAVESMTAAIMDLPVGKFAEAMDQAIPGSVDRSDIHPEDRLGDLAGADSRALPRKAALRTRSAMNAASGFAHMFAAMLPEFKRLGREMADRVEADMDKTDY